jgi:hypothetical protein
VQSWNFRRHEGKDNTKAVNSEWKPEVANRRLLICEVGHGVGEILRVGRFERDGFATCRVDESQRERVQGRATDQLRAGSTIQAVRQQWVTESVRVHPDLVRTPCPRYGFQPCRCRVALKDSEARLRGLTVRSVTFVR